MRAISGITALLLAAFALEGFVLFPSNWIGTYGGGVVTQPVGIAIGADGSSYVTSPFTKRVEKFSKAGTHLLGWGGVGGGPGQFQAPEGIAIAPSGEVYVADVVSGRIQRFTPQGVYVGEFGSTGSGPGEFDNPHALAIDASGNVFVADTYNHRVQKLTATGTYLGQWGGPGTALGSFDLPHGIAVDGKGDVYVADTYNHRIQKFDNGGAFLRTWGALGTNDDQFDYPNGIAVDAGGSVYVGDTNNHRVLRFNSKGALLSAWGQQGNAASEFFFPRGVAIGPDEDVHVCDSGNNRLQRFRRRQGQGHEALLTMGGPGTGNGLFSDIRGVAASSDGFVYAADKNGNKLQKFTNFGAWVASWGSSGSGDGQFGEPTGVALDSNGNVYVVDHLNARVQKFSPSGTFLAKWGSSGGGAGQFSAPWDIAIDAQDRVYVVDAHRIQRFTTAGAYVTGWSAPNAAGVGVDAEGFVYAACTSDHVVRKYAPDGTPVLTWGSFGNGVAQFNTPSDVVCDPNGSVYVCDSNGRVQQFTPMGGYLEEWGEPGTARRQIGAPQMMAVDPAGSIYVSEFLNSRVQKFASPPELYKVADVPGDEGGSVALTFVRSSAEASPGGELHQYRIFRYNPPNGVVVLDFAPGPTTVIVPSGGNANDTFDGIGEFEIKGLLSVPGAFPLSSSTWGYSTDDLAPPPPSPFTAAYEAGATWLHWGVGPADVAEYRVYFHNGPSWDQIHASPDTGYADAGPAGRFYRVAAIDTCQNLGAPSELGPEQTVDAPASSTLAFALEGAVPNPAAGRALTLRFSLPDALPARLELVNVAGRSTWSREVRGAGGHTLRATEAFAPGIYFVRLTRGGHALVRRAVVLP
jgi:tripartite motif-containing protein 71